ncbi:MAG TPA: diphthine synthase [Candidatus Thermoplasmatota archaeon]|nr:diphthine synthase [Candidatus Thermoplasmatota archaeon]
MGRLTFVGLGLWDERDVSLRGLDAIREADAVFVEWYTAFLGGTTLERMSAFYGRPVRALTREETEKGDLVLAAAQGGNAAFLTAGDSMTATTHAELRARAQALGIATEVVHGASIVTAAPGLLGIHNYKFGRATTIVFPEGSYFPTSPYDVVKANRERGLHTLCFLDLRAGGSLHENRPGTEAKSNAPPGAPPGRYMTASEGAALLLRMERERGEGVLSPETLACGIARAGSSAPKVVAGPLAKLAEVDFGPPLHILVVPGSLHFSEEEALKALAEWP